MSFEEIAAHYSSGDLWERLMQALEDAGADPERPTLEQLAPYDHFHGRGLEATEELAAGQTVGPHDHLLDIGSGLGGPARLMAARFGCRVTGIDLTREFCDVAERLNVLLGLSDRVNIEHGSATDMPFEAEQFDGAFSMNVSMNIEDKLSLYREIHRVLRPGAWLTLSEIAAGTNPDQLAFPTPWASEAAFSFLATPDETVANLGKAGFDVRSMIDSREAAARYSARSRDAVEAGGKPLHRAVMVVHGENAPAAMRNSGEAARAGHVIPIEVRCLRH